MSKSDKRLRIMAGPNGSGKSSILQKIRNSFYSGPFVNADEIEKTLAEKRVVNLPVLYNLDIDENSFKKYLKHQGDSWLKKAEAAGAEISVEVKNGMLTTPGKPSAYDAALCADFIRSCLVEIGATFTFETVLSHSSKVDFLRDCERIGYKAYLYFICTIDPRINIDRVAKRVNLGGHAVAREKIIKRYEESLLLLSDVLPYCYRAFFFDNSYEGQGINLVAEINEKKQFVAKTAYMPSWLDTYVVKKMYR